MKYNFEHKGDIDQFIQDNINEYVINKREFTYKKYIKYLKGDGKKEEEAKDLAKDIPTYTRIEVYLNAKFKKMLREKSFLERLEKELQKINVSENEKIDSELRQIAVEFCMEYEDIKGYFLYKAMQKIEIEWTKPKSKYRKACIERVLAYKEFLKKPLTVSEEVCVNEVLKESFEESIGVLLKGGFKKNLYDVDNGVNSGTKRSNEGDAAQFLFVARAILAGFSCSNVDVRTSPYDAVIDYNTFLLRVQVKGINHDRISFKTSPRGGAGSDTSAPTNVSKDITRSDCDLYVAVEKGSGICYIIPIGDVEKYLKNGKASLPNGDKNKYRERWDLVEIEAKERFGLK